MRCTEGANLIQDFTLRLDAIEAMLEEIGDQAAQLPDIYRQRLVERIEGADARDGRDRSGAHCPGGGAFS